MSLENQKHFSFPAGIFTYLSICKDYKRKNAEIDLKKTAKCANNLPFISSITRKFSPHAVVNARLSFLKYSH